MVDSASTKLYGQIKLNAKIRYRKKTILFQMEQITQNGMLGLDFLKNGCPVEVGRAVGKIDKRKLTCTNKNGKLLCAKVQVLKTMKFEPGGKFLVTCGFSNPVPGKHGLVKGGVNSGLTLAVLACLVRSNKYDVMPVRCFSPTSHPVTIPAESVIGSYVLITDEKISLN